MFHVFSICAELFAFFSCLMVFVNICSLGYSIIFVLVFPVNLCRCSWGASKHLFDPHGQPLTSGKSFIDRWCDIVRGIHLSSNQKLETICFLFRLKGSPYRSVDSGRSVRRRAMNAVLCTCFGAERVLLDKREVRQSWTKPKSNQNLSRSVLNLFQRCGERPQDNERSLFPTVSFFNRRSIELFAFPYDNFCMKRWIWRQEILP